MKGEMTVPLPDGWEWLDDLPDEWEPPPELAGPTPSTEINLVLRILSCEHLGHEVQAAVGRFVTEQALYLSWHVSDVLQAERPVKEAGLLADILDARTRRVYQVWKAFEDLPYETSAEQRMAAEGALSAALARAASDLAQTRESK